MTKESGEIIQAFPIHSWTVIGDVTTLDADGFKLIHAAEDTTVTLEFEDGNTLVVILVAGDDIGIGRGCKTIDSTAEVWMS